MPESSVVSAGDLVAQLTLDDSESISTARPFLGAFPPLAKPQVRRSSLTLYNIHTVQSA